MVSKRNLTIISGAMILLILVGILFSLTLFHKDEDGYGDQDQEIENSLLDDYKGCPVIIHLLFLDEVINDDAQSAHIQQITKLSMIGSETDDIDIITICRINDSDLQSGKDYLEDGFNLETSWSWLDDSDMDSIPEMCQNYYDDLTEHGGQTFIFLDRNQSLFSIFRLDMTGNRTDIDFLSYQEMIFKIRSINGEDTSDNWLENHSPSFGVGPQEHDWWATYPQQHPLYGSTPVHPRWLVDMLENGSVLIFGHSTNYMPCVEQQVSVEMVEQEYRESIQIVDLLSGVDERANDVMRLYDPNGSPNYIPSKILLAIVEIDDSYVQIVWHSAEVATGDDWLIKYITDSIFYHDKNIREWSS